MSLTLTNFKPAALDIAAGPLHVGDDGLITATAMPGARQIDCGGAYLSPGWCDLHVHVWHGGTDISVRPSEAGRATGVTAMADAGSAGEASFHGLREYVIEPQAETIKAFLNIGSVTKVVPVVGVTLPFLSFGGTSLVVTMAAVGVLLSLARQGR